MKVRKGSPERREEGNEHDDQRGQPQLVLIGIQYSRQQFERAEGSNVPDAGSNWHGNIIWVNAILGAEDNRTHRHHACVR